MNPAEPPSEDQELKKLEEELKGLGNTPQEVSTETQPVDAPPSPVTTPTPPSVPETPLPPGDPKPKNKILMMAIGFLVLALAGAGAYVLFNREAAPKACTEDAKLCPDGSGVGRIGPNCEFAPCPVATPDPTLNWTSYQITELTFKYPNNWQLDTGGKRISSSNPKVTLDIFSSNDPMYNECMAETETVRKYDLKRGLYVNYYSHIQGREACSNPETWNQREIWIIKSYSDGQPGIIYSYLSDQSTEAEKYFDQILSTFKFIDTSSYVCPTGEDPNCSDYLPNAGVRLECTPEYQAWAVKNCPTYRTGAASSPKP